MCFYPKDIVRFLIDCGSRLIPGLFETERCFYGALTREIRDVLKEHKANPNKFDHLGQNMQGLRSLMLHSDFRLTVDGLDEKEPQTKTFDLHRFVLSMRSEWFSNQFETSWDGLSEATIITSQSKIFPSVAIASAILDFIYTSKIDIDEDDAPSVIQSLHILNFIGLSKAIKAESSKKDRELKSIVLHNEKERNRLTNELGAAFTYFSTPTSNHDSSIPSFVLEQKAWHDICLEVIDEESKSHFYACHRALLSQHSSFFHAMISGSFKEAISLRSSQGGATVGIERKRIGKEEIKEGLQSNEQSSSLSLSSSSSSSSSTTIVAILPMVDIRRADLFRIAISFLYTNSLVSDLSLEDTISLMEMSDKLLLMELKRMCAVRMRKDLNSNNAFKFLRLGDIFSIRLLRQASLNYIEQHIKELYDTPAFALALEENPADIAQELRLYVSDKIDQ
jgi:hypothetical protein